MLRLLFINVYILFLLPKVLSESVTSIQGGSVGKESFDEVITSTYTGKPVLLGPRQGELMWAAVNAFFLVQAG